MLTQAGISERRLARKVGTTQRVLIDHVEDGVAIGRSTADAPEIDGCVVIEPGARFEVGEFAEVEIDTSDEHDLFAHPV
jgi:ribosomal protein S12 methylthiotransferase